METPEIVRTRDIANLFKIDIETVRRNAQDLGGVKLGGNWFFNLGDVLSLFKLREDNNAIEKNQKRQDNRISCTSEEAGSQQKQAMQNTDRSKKPRVRMAGRNPKPVKSVRSENRHGLGLGECVS